MQENKADGETRLRELASKLFFTLKGQGSQFALSRDVDVPKLVRHDGLTLDEVEHTQYVETSWARWLMPV